MSLFLENHPYTVILIKDDHISKKKKFFFKPRYHLEFIRNKDFYSIKVCQQYLIVSPNLDKEIFFFFK